MPWFNLAMATEESQAQLHGKGLRPSGLYSIEGSLKEEQYQNREYDTRHAHDNPRQSGST